MTTADDGSLGRRAARGGTITVLAQFARFIVQFSATLVLARILAPQDFGLVAMVVAITGIAVVIGAFGLATAASHARVLTGGQRTNLFWANTAIGVVAGAAIAVAAPAIVLLYGEERLAVLVPFLAIPLVLNGAATQHLTSLARELRFGRLAIVEIGSVTIGVGASVLAALGGWGVWALVLQPIAIGTATLLGSIIAGGWLPGLPDRKSSIRELVRIGAHLLGTRSLAYSAQNADTVVLGIIGSATLVGYYNRAYQLVQVPLAQINAPLSRVAIPVLSKFSRTDPRFQHYLQRAQLLSCYVTIPVFALMAGASAALIPVLFGPGWEATIPLLMLLSISGVFRSAAQATYWLFVAGSATAQQLRANIVIQSVIIVGILVGAVWGAIGIAASLIVTYAIAWIIGLLWAGKATQVPIGGLFWTALRSIVLVALPVFLVAWTAVTLSSGDILGIILALLSSAAAVGVVALIAPPIRRDLGYAVSLVAKFRR